VGLARWDTFILRKTPLTAAKNAHTVVQMGKMRRYLYVQTKALRLPNSIVAQGQIGIVILVYHQAHLAFRKLELMLQQMAVLLLEQ